MFSAFTFLFHNTAVGEQKGSDLKLLFIIHDNTSKNKVSVCC